jgi:hypothetical protein
MTLYPKQATEIILKSFATTPLLIADLPEAPHFPESDLAPPDDLTPLNFSQKLGHLYEDALAQIFAASKNYDLLERNLQIQKDIHTTIGELDFLLRNLDSNQIIHLECATKFYLAVGSDLPGPDARDNYFKKLTHLRQHQLQLTHSFQDLLPTKYRDEDIITKQLVHGCLFDHIEAETTATPEFLNPKCRRGKWLSQTEIPIHFPAGQEFQVIPKTLWPIPLKFLPKITLESWEPTQPLERCTMVRVPNKPIPYFIAPAEYPHYEGTL